MFYLAEAGIPLCPVAVGGLLFSKQLKQRVSPVFFWFSFLHQMFDIFHHFCHDWLLRKIN